MPAKSRKSGLPGSSKMRHDHHFVDLLTTREEGPQIRMIPLEKIDPNPRQARSELGNINELMASIKNKGILEPIIVRPKNGRYEIIAGERRFIASKKLRMKKIPCIEKDVEDNEAMELALIENMQRKDLDAFEEADGLKALAESYDYSHNEISERIGKARSTITESINISVIPLDIRKICKDLKISSKSTLIEIAKQKTFEDMHKLLMEIKSRNLGREDTRELSKKIKGKETKIKRFVYNYKGQSPERFKLRLEFKKQEVSKSEIIRILEEVIEKLKNN